MKTWKNALWISLLCALAGVAVTGCELGGLDLQKSEVFHPHVLDPHTHMTAWQYLQERSDSTRIDTVFSWMKKAIAYADMDSTAYSDTGRTFIFLHNNAVVDSSKHKVTSTCYFGKYLIVERDANGDTVFNAGKPVMIPARS